MDCYGVSEISLQMTLVILNNAKILFRWFMFRLGKLRAFPIFPMLNMWCRWNLAFSEKSTSRLLYESFFAVLSTYTERGNYIEISKVRVPINDNILHWRVILSCKHPPFRWRRSQVGRFWCFWTIVRYSLGKEEHLRRDTILDVARSH